MCPAGLSHSDHHSALMAPFYRGFQASLSLDTDDVTAVQVSRTSLSAVRTPVQ